MMDVCVCLNIYTNHGNGQSPTKWPRISNNLPSLGIQSTALVWFPGCHFWKEVFHGKVCTEVGTS